MPAEATETTGKTIYDSGKFKPGLLWGDHVHVDQITEESDAGNPVIVVEMHTVGDHVHCPHCDGEDVYIRSYYTREIAEVPLAGIMTRILVRVRKFECLNEACPVSIFSEELDFAHRSQHRTDALNALILAVGLMMSCRSASLVLSLAGIEVSHDVVRTLINSVDIRELTNADDVTEIGIDDVALRKGDEYATAIYSRPTGLLLALLPGRDAQTVSAWLQDHKKIRRVARDRASAYAKAIRETLKDCEQVADRFHLFENILKLLSDLLNVELPKELYGLPNGEISETAPSGSKTGEKIVIEYTEDTDGLSYTDAAPTDENGNTIEVNADTPERAKAREKVKKNVS